jgi:hypothetical protein
MSWPVRRRCAGRRDLSGAQSLPGRGPPRERDERPGSLRDSWLVAKCVLKEQGGLSTAALPGRGKPAARFLELALFCSDARG